MTYFRGTVQGNGQQTSRLGSKVSGLLTTCNSWKVGVLCIAYFDKILQKDVVAIYSNGGSAHVEDNFYLIGCLVEGSKALHSNLSSIPVQV